MVNVVYKRSLSTLHLAHIHQEGPLSDCATLKVRARSAQGVCSELEKLRQFWQHRVMQMSKSTIAAARAQRRHAARASYCALLYYTTGQTTQCTQSFALRSALRLPTLPPYSSSAPFLPKVVSDWLSSHGSLLHLASLLSSIQTLLHKVLPFTRCVFTYEVFFKVF